MPSVPLKGLFTDIHLCYRNLTGARLSELFASINTDCTHVYVMSNRTGDSESQYDMTAGSESQYKTADDSESQYEDREPTEGETVTEGKREGDPSPTVTDGRQMTGATEYDDRDDELAVYEYVGMFAAGLGFFLTPVFTAPVVAYCVLKIREAKPLTSQLLIALVLTTAVFWAWVIIFVF